MDFIGQFHRNYTHHLRQKYLIGSLLLSLLLLFLLLLLV